MPSDRLKQLVRHFPENGVKWLLENSQNIRDLIRLLRPDLTKAIDFDRLQIAAKTFVQRDFRHSEADIVAYAPLALPQTKNAPTKVLIYILIEHQSEPDALMILRVLDYMVQIFKTQVREWGQEHGSLASISLHPVLPIVFYTGSRPWSEITTLADLIAHGSQFAEATPSFHPLFLNLAETSSKTLAVQGGFFGQVLSLIQKRQAPLEDFRVQLRRAVQALEAMPAAQRLRWLELLSYIHALIYYQREPMEISPLQEVVEKSVLSDEHRREVVEMKTSYADELKVQGHREALLLQLQARFPKVPQETTAIVENTQDLTQLKEWLKRILTAKSLKAVGIN
jgi:hypothetical protein